MDYLSEAYMLVAEAMIIAQRKGVPFQGIFFQKFRHMLKDSVEFHVTIDAMEEDSPYVAVSDGFNSEMRIMMRAVRGQNQQRN